MYTLAEAQRQVRIDEGDVATGSEWDGVHIIDVYEQLRSMHSQVIAAEQTRQIRENRAAVA
jgi:hypothetical protein